MRSLVLFHQVWGWTSHLSHCSWERDGNIYPLGWSPPDLLSGWEQLKHQPWWHRQRMGREVEGITGVSSMWEKMQAGGKVGSESSSKGEINVVCVSEKKRMHTGIGIITHLLSSCCQRRYRSLEQKILDNCRATCGQYLAIFYVMWAQSQCLLLSCGTAVAVFLASWGTEFRCFTFSKAEL